MTDRAKEPPMTAPYTAADSRGAELGWTRAAGRSNFPHCPRRLARKHGRNSYEYGTCWCGSPLNDHGDTWREHDGTRFVLWEPYGADGNLLTELIAVARRDGLRVRLCESVWNPPHTIGIRFEASS